MINNDPTEGGVGADDEVEDTFGAAETAGKKAAGKKAAGKKAAGKKDPARSTSDSDPAWEPEKGARCVYVRAANGGGALSCAATIIRVTDDELVDLRYQNAKTGREEIARDVPRRTRRDHYNAWQPPRGA